MDRKRQLKQRVKDFNEYSNEVKRKHENWGEKKNTISDILKTKKEDYIIKYLEDDYEVEVQKNSSIKLVVKNDYLHANLSYEKIYNGKVKVSISYPEIEDEEGEPVCNILSIYNAPDEISEIPILNDLDRFFYNFHNFIYNFNV